MDTNNILALLEQYTIDNPDDVAMEIANDFRRRRIEKNLTREQVAEMSQVPLSNIARFEQKGLVSLQNLIKIAMAVGYTSDIKNIFKTQKYQTMDEMLQIKRNLNKKRATKK
ncbi:MAG: helix-turn-helix domain-containing protein [Bacteroidales bacterium]|nr:helix-turn-helix domain-containing protein [Bacteroidales bacterium]